MIDPPSEAEIFRLVVEHFKEESPDEEIAEEDVREFIKSDMFKENVLPQLLAKAENAKSESSTKENKHKPDSPHAVSKSSDSHHSKKKHHHSSSSNAHKSREKDKKSSHHHHWDRKEKEKHHSRDKSHKDSRDKSKSSSDKHRVKESSSSDKLRDDKDCFHKSSTGSIKKEKNLEENKYTNVVVKEEPGLSKEISKSHVKHHRDSSSTPLITEIKKESKSSKDHSSSRDKNAKKKVSSSDKTHSTKKLKDKTKSKMRVLDSSSSDGSSSTCSLLNPVKRELQAQKLQIKPKVEKQEDSLLSISSSSKHLNFVSATKPVVDDSKSIPPARSVASAGSHEIEQKRKLSGSCKSFEEAKKIKLEPEPSIPSVEKPIVPKVPSETGETVKPVMEKEIGKSIYNRRNARITKLSAWKPFSHPTITDRLQGRFSLRSCSVIICDMKKMDSVFSNPENSRQLFSSAATIPLENHMTVTPDKINIIMRLERLKRHTFSEKLKKVYMKLNGKRHGAKNKAWMKSDSSESSFHARSRNKKGNKTTDRRTSHEKSKDKFNRKNTRPHEKVQGNLFRPKPTEGMKQKKKKEDEMLKKKNARLAEKKRLEKSTFARVWEQVVAANKLEASKPKVELKIPKLENTKRETMQETLDSFETYDIAMQVQDILKSNIKLDFPVMSSDVNALTEYTVRKLAWWLLKCEEDPCDEILYHPEVEDCTIEEKHAEIINDAASDCSSVGCVSDPEGLMKEEMAAKTVELDDDCADEYCVSFGRINMRILKGDSAHCNLSIFVSYRDVLALSLWLELLVLNWNQKIL